MAATAWKCNVGPLLRYDTVDEQGTYHAFVLIVTEHAPGATQAAPPTLTYAAQVARSGQEPQMVGNAMQSQGIRLAQYDDVDNGTSHLFWRFKIEIKLLDVSQMVTYAVMNATQPETFHVPAREQDFHWAGHSCNGFSSGTPEDEWGGADPLWRDVLKVHEERPFHMVMGGGDQIYNDKITKEPELQEWVNQGDPHKRMAMPLTPEISKAIDRYLFRHYCQWFGGGTFSKAIAKIPMCNMLDDHDLIDGFGTYPDDLMTAAIFNAIGSRGFHFYLLFQQFINNDVDGISNSSQDPQTAFRSMIIGGPGAYVPYPTCSFLTYLGPKQYMLLLDCRAQRKINQICAPDTYEKCFAAIKRLPAGVEHLIIQLGVPLAYPRMVGLERMLSSGFNPIVWVAKKLLPTFSNNFNGQVELLDDLNDHWCALHHKRERNWLIERTQEIAMAKKLRISFISGDVHAGGCSVFSGHGRTPPEKDPKYNVAVITSAIVNAPPPAPVITMMNTLARKKHRSLMYTRTKEQMLPLFDVDFDGKKQRNKYIVGARNWCEVYVEPKSSDLVYDLRVEHPKGSGQATTYTIKTPPPLF